MPRLEIPIGARFCRLTVIGEVAPAVEPSGQTKRMVLCKCECGTTLAVRLTNLRTKHTQSCGCLSVELLIDRGTTHGQAKPGQQSANYRLWCSIKNRTVLGTATASTRYAGRGITLYAPWVDDFISFDTWIRENLGPRQKNYSLDRINNDGNYEPGNLRWATPREQSNNTRRNRNIEFGGKTQTIAQWAREVDLGWATLNARLFRYNWPVDKALTTPARSNKNAD